MPSVTLPDGRRFPLRHAGSPLCTNAMRNRGYASKVFAAGGTVEEVAAMWPEAFQAVPSADGLSTCLSQLYDYALDDGTGRCETRRLIPSASLRKALRRVAARLKKEAKG